MYMSMGKASHTFLSTLAGAAAAFAAGATVFGVGFAIGIAGAVASGFAVFLSDLGPLPIAEVGDGLIRKEEVGFKATKFFRSAKLQPTFSACGPRTYRIVQIAHKYRPWRL